MIARGRITTEEEAKAALAERRRLAREQAEREAELERQRLNILWSVSAVAFVFPSDNKTRAQSATEREGGAKPPKVPSTKKSTPKPADTPSKKTAPSATEKLQATKTATKTSPKVSPVHSPGEPAQLEQITDSSEEKKDEGKEISDKSDMQKSVDGLEKQDEMKPVEGETVESKEYEKKEEKAETEMKEEQVKKEESKIDKIDVSEGKERIENSTEGKEPDKGESSQDVDMT
ncbi:hypothetical protein J437_LFUL019576, partial [Ladona fulva]